MIENHRSFPSIVLYVVFNEGWGQYDVSCASCTPTVACISSASGCIAESSGHPVLCEPFRRMSLTTEF